MSSSTSEFNKDQVLRSYSFNLSYAKDLVIEVANEQLYLSPDPGLENHPGFTLGHLVIASAMVADCLEKAYDVPKGWDDFFARTGPGDPRLPQTNSSGLPSKDALIKELGRQHDIVDTGIKQFDSKKFTLPANGDSISTSRPWAIW